MGWNYTDDSRVAYVITWEGLAGAPCIHLSELGALPLNQSNEIAPASLTVDSFENEIVRRNGAALSEGEGKNEPFKIEGVEVVRGQSQTWCGASIRGPLVVGDISIIEFSSPNGDIGAHAFVRRNSNWHHLERTQLGQW